MSSVVAPPAGEVLRNRRPSAARLVLSQAHWANRSFWRTPIAAFFTLAFPLTFLVVLSAALGNVVVDQRQGIRLAQFLTPALAVFGVAMASFSALAIGVAESREAGLLKRLRGTPVAAWMLLAGRIVSSVWISLIAVVLMLAVGTTFFGVVIIWSKVPALVVSLIAGIACFAALGLAVTALAHSATVVQTITMGLLVSLSYISDVFAFGTLPVWLDRIGWVFPLRHVANAMADDLNPYLTGSGFYADHLLVVAAWTAGGLLVAVRYFSWEPHAHDGLRARTGRGGRATAAGPRRRTTVGVGAVLTPGRPTTLQLMADQTRAGARSVWRNRTGTFFATFFPVVLLVFFTIMNEGARWRGVSLAAYLAPVLTVYGIASMTLTTVPQSVCQARESGAMKRLNGTPLPAQVYLAGRISSALLVSLATAGLIYGVAVVFLGVRVGAAAVAWCVVALIVGTVCFTLLGLMLAYLVRSSASMTAAGLGILLPLSFISDIFMFGSQLPTALSVIGWVFPLRHFANAAFEASVSTGLAGPATADWWGHLAVMCVWAGAAALVLRRLYRHDVAG